MLLPSALSLQEKNSQCITGESMTMIIHHCIYRLHDVYIIITGKICFNVKRTEQLLSLDSGLDGDHVHVHLVC